MKCLQTHWILIVPHLFAKPSTCPGSSGLFGHQQASARRSLHLEDVLLSSLCKYWPMFRPSYVSILPRPLCCHSRLVSCKLERFFCLNSVRGVQGRNQLTHSCSPVSYISASQCMCERRYTIWSIQCCVLLTSSAPPSCHLQPAVTVQTFWFDVWFHLSTSGLWPKQCSLLLLVVKKSSWNQCHQGGSAMMTREHGKPGLLEVCFSITLYFTFTLAKKKRHF